MTLSSSPPWQFNWKRPQADCVVIDKGINNDDRDRNNEGRLPKGAIPMASCAARLVPQEHEKNNDSTAWMDDGLDLDQDYTTVENGNQERQRIDNEFNNDNQTILTVTLFNTSSSSSSSSYSHSTSSTNASHPDVGVAGDVILLELVRSSSSSSNMDSSEEDEGKGGESKEQNSDSTENVVIKSRLLRWPASALAAPPPQQQQADQSSSSREGKKSFAQHVVPWLIGGEIKSRNYVGDGAQGSSSPPQYPSGLVSVALCRKRKVVTNHNGGKMADALDLLTMMSLGIGSFDDTNTTDIAMQKKQDEKKKQISAAVNEKWQSSAMYGLSTRNTNEILSELQDNADDDEENDASHNQTELLLVCLTNDGAVHLYSALDLLEKGKTGERQRQDDGDTDEFENGFASMLLGADFYRHIRQSIVPLSRPLATVELSVPLSSSPSRQNRNRRKKDDKNEETDNRAAMTDDSKVGKTDSKTSTKKFTRSDNNAGRDSDSKDSGNSNSEEQVVSILDLSALDAVMEPSTAVYRTVSNIPYLVESAFDYVAIGGRGIRRQRRRIKKKSTDATTQQQQSSHRESPRRRATAASASDEQKGQRVGKSSSTQHDKPQQKQQHYEWEDFNEEGGFVTFVSLTHLTETRTVYLPFVPKKLAPVSWAGMYFMVVLGEDYNVSSETTCIIPRAVAIRLDAYDDVTTICGKDPSAVEEPLDATESTQQHKQPSSSFVVLSETEKARRQKEATKKTCSIRRFHLTPILLPTITDPVLAGKCSSLAVTSIQCSPPAIDFAFYNNTAGRDSAGDALSLPEKQPITVVRHTLHCFDYVSSRAANSAMGIRDKTVTAKGASRPLAGPTAAVKTNYKVTHFCTLTSDEQENSGSHKNKNEDSLLKWCCSGQGWSIIGMGSKRYFVCWEGATSTNGAFFTEIDVSGSDKSISVDAITAPVLPVYYFERGQRPAKQHHHIENVRLPFDETIRFPAGMRGIDKIANPSSYGRENFYSREIEHDQNGLDPVVLGAIGSISDMSFAEASINSLPRRKYLNISHVEKSTRLLRQCSSWTDLDYKDAKRSYFYDQVPVLLTRLVDSPQQSLSFSLRKAVIVNGSTSPFHQVLAWFCQEEDYYTAASIALTLMDDFEALGELRKLSTDVSENKDDFVSYRKGLLEGISSLGMTTTSLADMTVGCLVRGGFEMSKTLDLFLARSNLYDASRTSIMLVATAASAVSGDKDSMQSVMSGKLEGSLVAPETMETAGLLWPIHSLLRVAVSRDCMPTALLLLNATLPDELRRRVRKGVQSASAAIPSMELCKDMVTMIIQASPDAAGLLLSLADDDSETRYWSSLNHETRRELAVIQVDAKFPLLLELEVRTWAIEQVNRCVEEEGSTGVNETSQERLPSTWLQQLCYSCLFNAGCLISRLTSKDSNGDSQEAKDPNGSSWEAHLQEFRNDENALVPTSGSGGLDFDLLIPTLLLLVNRSVSWHPKASTSSQTLLDAACYLAGRATDEEPRFPFDGATVMRQCAVAGNVSAGANLIGGRDGLVLMCCDVLIQEAGMKMEEAEHFVLSEQHHMPAPKKGGGGKAFHLTKGLRQILWLLDEHVLKITRFGEFEAPFPRGSVDPVLAAKFCLKTWSRLNVAHTEEASEWLVRWLRERLGIVEESSISPRRLACAALCRALIWQDSPDAPSTEHVLGVAMKMELSFLIQIAEASCGLVEPIPQALREDLLQRLNGTGPGDQHSMEELSSVEVDV